MGSVAVLWQEAEVWGEERVSIPRQVWQAVAVAVEVGVVGVGQRGGRSEH